MKRYLTVFFVSCLLLFFSWQAASARLEILFPFQPQVDKFYMKTLTSSFQGAELMITENYFTGGHSLVQFEVGDEIMRLILTEEWAPTPDQSLFYSNYELRFVGTDKAAGRSGLVVELHRKRDGRLLERYLIDQETGLTLNHYSYDEEGCEYFASEVLEIDYNPDFSDLDWTNRIVVGPIRQKILNEEDIYSSAPWLDLTDLPLPPGFQLVAFSQAEYVHHLTELGEGILHIMGNFPAEDLQMAQSKCYLSEKYPDTPLTHVWLWASDGLASQIIEISFATDRKIEIGSGQAAEIVERRGDLTSAALVNQPAVINFRGVIPTKKQVTEVLKALVKIEEIRNLKKLDSITVRNSPSHQ